MRSEITKRIISETSEDTRKEVKEHADKLIMTAETKKQIERDATDKTFYHDGHLGYIDGATIQDAVATNRTVDEVIKIIDDCPQIFYSTRGYENFRKSLEKLKSK